MDRLMAVKRGEVSAQAVLADEQKVAERRARRQRSLAIAAARRAREEPEEQVSRSDVATDNAVPTPPFVGSRVVRGIPLADYASMLDERATFMGQWGLRGARGDKGPSYEELVESEGRPRLRYWLDRLQTEGVLEAAVVFHLATMGNRISEFAQTLFEADNYRDYLEVHGLSVQLTEALAEYWHKRIRQELRFADGTSAASADPGSLDDYFRLEYRGARYSFGYPACPNLEDQVQLVELLDPSRIGVSLSEEFQLHPEQSTSAIVVHHPEAKYFAV